MTEGRNLESGTNQDLQPESRLKERPRQSSVLSVKKVIGDRIKRVLLAASISLPIGVVTANAGRELAYNAVGTSNQEVADYINSPEVQNSKSWTEIIEGSPELQRQLSEEVSVRQEELERNLQEIQTRRDEQERIHAERLASLNELNAINLSVSQFITELEQVENAEQLQSWQSRLAEYVSSISDTFVSIRNTIATVLVSTINNSTGSFQEMLREIMTLVLNVEHEISMLKLNLESTYQESLVQLEQLSDTVDNYARLYSEIGTMFESIKASSTIAIHNLLFYIQFLVYSIMLFRLSNGAIKYVKNSGIIANEAELNVALKELEFRATAENKHLRKQIAVLTKKINALTTGVDSDASKAVATNVALETEQKPTDITEGLTLEKPQKSEEVQVADEPQVTVSLKK